MNNEEGQEKRSDKGEELKRNDKTLSIVLSCLSEVYSLEMMLGILLKCLDKLAISTYITPHWTLDGVGENASPKSKVNPR